jgi:hypothetical protein
MKRLGGPREKVVDCGARVFATNQSPPNGARVVYGRSIRARPFPSYPRVASARLLRRWIYITSDVIREIEGQHANWQN